MSSGRGPEQSRTEYKYSANDGEAIWLRLMHLRKIYSKSIGISCEHCFCYRAAADGGHITCAEARQGTPFDMKGKPQLLSERGQGMQCLIPRQPLAVGLAKRAHLRAHKCCRWARNYKRYGTTLAAARCARWYRRRPLHAAPPPSRIQPLSERRRRPPPGRLRPPPTSPGPGLAGARAIRPGLRFHRGLGSWVIAV